MSKEKVVSHTFTEQAEPGSNGRGLASGRSPDEIIPAREVQLVDKHLDLHLEHQMRKTARKQAEKMSQARRQSELDGFRAEQALWMYNDLLAKAARKMSDLCHFRDACLRDLHPDAAIRFERMADRALEIEEKLPEAGVMLLLSRYGLI
jgi:hypothetical protein